MCRLTCSTSFPDTDSPARNKSGAGAGGAGKSRPAAFFEPSLAKLVTIGNFDDNLKWLAECDWIIEAVVENLEIKRALLKKVEAVRKPGTIVTTNTSGLPVATIAEGFTDEFRRHWFGTHFFNPPRYMRLLEIIPTPDTDPAAMDAIAHFCDVRLGKGIVWAKDTPNFIANRIGTFSVLNMMRLMQQMDLSIEEVDALTGPAVGWPKSATFRTMDMVGLDVLGHVVRNMQRTCATSAAIWTARFLPQMLERKLLGRQDQGRLLQEREEPRRRTAARRWTGRRSSIVRAEGEIPSSGDGEEGGEPAERLTMLLDSGGGKRDKAGQFLWTALRELWTYAANRIPEISDTVVEIDRAMRLGFNWELGPFELWDAAGVEATVARMKKEGKPVAANVEKLLASGARPGTRMRRTRRRAGATSTSAR